MHGWAKGTVAAVVAGVVLYFVPLVRLAPLDADPSPDPDAFDPTAFAEQFWQDRLLPAAHQAADADAVLAALAEDPKSAASKFGRRVGVSRGFFVFLKSEVTVVGPGKRGMLATTPDDAQILVETGPIFGSAVRDSTGLLEASAVPTSRDFNAVSEELCGLVEKRVSHTAKSLQPGALVRVVGCAKIQNPERVQPPLRITPIIVEAL